MQHDVFISYSSKDKQIADALVHYLEEQKIRCWIAPRDIMGGAEYADVIVEAIESTSVALVLFSETAQESQWVRSEVNRAMSFGKVIIPVKISDVMPEKGMGLYLGDKHWVDIFPDVEANFCKVLPAIRNGLGTAGLKIAKRKNEQGKPFCWYELFRKYARSIFSIVIVSMLMVMSGVFYSWYRDKVAVRDLIVYIDRLDGEVERVCDSARLDPSRIELSMSENRIERAVTWLEDAARRMDPGAQYYFGRCKEMGVGTATNHQEAEALFWKAGSHGVPRAKFRLAVKYLYGIGVPKDEIKAGILARESAKDGFGPAISVVRKIEQHKQSTTADPVTHEIMMLDKKKRAKSSGVSAEVSVHSTDKPKEMVAAVRKINLAPSTEFRIQTRNEICELCHDTMVIRCKKCAGFGMSSEVVNGPMGPFTITTPCSECMARGNPSVMQCTNILHKLKAYIEH